jgi:hypothetical protein
VEAVIGGKRKLVDFDRTDLWTLLDGDMKKVIHCKKATFPSSAGMSLTKL